jgi:hypothetical protein
MWVKVRVRVSVKRVERRGGVKEVEVEVDEVIIVYMKALQ